MVVGAPGHQAAITGVGLSAPGRKNPRPVMDLMLDAVEEALADAGLALSEIDGIATWPSASASAGMAPIGVIELKETLGIDLNWYLGVGEGPGQYSSIINAISAVVSGQARHVLCYRTLEEFSAIQRRRAQPQGEAANARISGNYVWQRPFNALSVVNSQAMMAKRHMHEFGTTKEQLGWVAVNARRNAMLNSRANYRDPMSIDDYFNARMISDPLGLFDCDAPTDAATVIIISSLDAARDLRKAPLRIEAMSGVAYGRNSWEQYEPLSGMAALEAGQQLWKHTDLKPADVNVANLYDGFTIQTLIWLEALGFCKRGESGPFVEGGSRIARDGALPLNTGGGQLSMGRMHGFGLLWETCLQLWGEAGERQVPGSVDVGVAAAGGGPLAGCLLLARH
jgi:acetyl-CoA acetyltransferase